MTSMKFTSTDAISSLNGLRPYVAVLSCRAPSGVHCGSRARIPFQKKEFLRNTVRWRHTCVGSVLQTSWASVYLLHATHMLQNQFPTLWSFWSFWSVLEQGSYIKCDPWLEHGLLEHVELPSKMMGLWNMGISRSEYSGVMAIGCPVRR